MDGERKEGRKREGGREGENRREEREREKEEEGRMSGWLEDAGKKEEGKGWKNRESGIEWKEGRVGEREKVEGRRHGWREAKKGRKIGTEAGSL